MNVRKALLILGILALAIVTALTAIGIIAHRQMELARNRAKIGPAARKRWAEKPQGDRPVDEVEEQLDEEVEETLNVNDTSNESLRVVS